MQTLRGSLRGYIFQKTKNEASKIFDVASALPTYKMLLDLPRDVVEYILSIVIYRLYIREYILIEENANEMTQTACFVSSYQNSRMSRLMRKLGLIHPQILQMLRRATKTENQRTAYGRVWRVWKFRQSFFHTLISHSEYEKKF